MIRRIASRTIETLLVAGCCCVICYAGEWVVVLNEMRKRRGA